MTQQYRCVVDKTISRSEACNRCVFGGVGKGCTSEANGYNCFAGAAAQNLPFSRAYFVPVPEVPAAPTPAKDHLKPRVWRVSRWKDAPPWRCVVPQMVPFQLIGIGHTPQQAYETWLKLNHPSAEVRS